MPRVRLALNASDIDDCGRLPHQAARHQASQAPFRLRQLRSPFTWRVPRMDPADVLASRREPGMDPHRRTARPSALRRAWAIPGAPTNDADTVIDVRADPEMLHPFTRTLTDIGFESAGISVEGRQHRWVRGKASIDVLLPEGLGERASEHQGVVGSPTLPPQASLRRPCPWRARSDGDQGLITPHGY